MSLSGRLMPHAKRRERTMSLRSRRNLITSHGRSKRWLGSRIRRAALRILANRKYRYTKPCANEVGNHSVTDEADVIRAMQPSHINHHNAEADNQRKRPTDAG